MTPRALVVIGGALLVLIVVAFVVPLVIMRRRHYDVGRDVIVRCAAGHRYTTIWIPSLSLKAVRLGLRRYQHCPVGRHWSLTSPVDVTTLSAEEIAAARAVHDIRLP